MSANRQIRVFVSSTFRDMQAERDYLVKFIFPALRKLCDSRGVNWGEVDLRWGITDEQAAEGKVLPLCLEEIQRCRPYFIGLLGERYGWVPQNVPSELLETQAWLKEHPHKSVTELEIIHGVLRHEQMHGHAFFYFRDKEYIDRLPPGSNRSDLESENAEFAAKLSRLKQSIRNARDEQVCYLRESYRDPEELGRWILADFTALIDQLFPEDQKPDSLDREAADHEAFAESRGHVYIGRPEYFERLNAHAAGNEQPLVVTGESGSGKSALLANWAARHRTTHPQNLVVAHFIGATPYSSDWALMLRRIMREFKRRFAITEEIPDQSDALCATFANWLHIAAAQGTVVLILDGLNQLEDRDGALDLVWLPPVIPANVRIVLSTLPGRSLDNLNKRRWPTLAIQPLGHAERSQLIAAYLTQYTKALDRSRTERIVTAPQSANPLYLRALLEELRVFGSHEQLDQRIAHYLEAGTIAELYQKILDRWESDYGGATNLVRNAMTLLWAARRGLYESELLDLLGAGGLPLAGAHWSPFHLAAEPALINRSGLLNFFHQYLREAVQQKYLSSKEERHAIHLRLADYFNAHEEFSIRKFDELPWQLAEAEEWERLCQLLANPGDFLALWSVNSFEVRALWTRIETHSRFRMLDAYRSVLDEPGKNSAMTQAVAILFATTRHSAEAALLQEFIVNDSRGFGSPLQKAKAFLNFALTLQSRGEFARAADLLGEGESLCRELGDLAALQVNLGAQAVLFQMRGQLDRAMELFREQEKICRDTSNLDGLSRCLGEQGLVAKATGDFRLALQLLKEQERLCKQSGNRNGVSISLCNQATVSSMSGEVAEAERLVQEGESLSRQLGSQVALASAVTTRGLILDHKGEHVKAEGLHREGLQLARETKDLTMVQACLGQLGHNLKDQGKLDEALNAFDEQLAIARELGLVEMLVRGLFGKADLLQSKMNRSREAMIPAEEAFQLASQHGYKKLAELTGRLLGGIRASFSQEGLVFYREGRLAEAAACFQEDLRVARILNHAPMIAASLGALASMYQTMGKMGDAYHTFLEKEDICRKLDDAKGVADCLHSEGIILHGSDQMEAALQALQEGIRVAQSAGYQGGVENCLSFEVCVHRDSGALAPAQACCRNLIDTCRRSGNQQLLTWALKTSAELASDR